MNDLLEFLNNAVKVYVKTPSEVTYLSRPQYINDFRTALLVWAKDHDMVLGGTINNTRSLSYFFDSSKDQAIIYFHPDSKDLAVMFKLSFSCTGYS